MNLVEKRIRDKFLTRAVAETDLIDFSEMEGFLDLFYWSKKQPWRGDFFKDHPSLIEHWDREAFVNAVYRFLEK